MGGGCHPIAKYGRAMEDVSLYNAEFIRVARTKDNVRFGIIKEEVLERYDWARRGGFRSDCRHIIEQ